VVSAPALQWEASKSNLLEQVKDSVRLSPSSLVWAFRLTNIVPTNSSLCRPTMAPQLLTASLVGTIKAEALEVLSLPLKLTNIRLLCLHFNSSKSPLRTSLLPTQAASYSQICPTTHKT
jgi:hypothetical protein